MLARICVGSACTTLLIGIVFAALALNGGDVDDGGVGMVLATLILLSTVLMAGLVAWVGLSDHGDEGTSQLR